MAATVLKTTKGLFIHWYHRKQRDNYKIDTGVSAHHLKKVTIRINKDTSRVNTCRHCPIISKGDKPNHVVSTRRCTFESATPPNNMMKYGRESVLLSSCPHQDRHKAQDIQTWSGNRLSWVQVILA